VLTVDDAQISVRASYVDCDPPADLLDAVIALFHGARVSWASLWEEPESNRWLFRQRKSALQIDVVHNDEASPQDVLDTHTRFTAEVDRRDLGRALADGMADMVDGQNPDRPSVHIGEIRERITELRRLIDGGATAPVPKRLYTNMDRHAFGGWSSDLVDHRPPDEPPDPG
jgi:hypothetical protein